MTTLHLLLPRTMLLTVLALLLEATLNGGVSAFQLSPVVNKRSVIVPPRHGCATAMHMGNAMDFFRDFLNPSPDDRKKNGEKQDFSFSSDTTEDDSSSTTSCVVRVPVVSLKKGGLRLFFLFYLMGLQNIPEKGSWRINQPSHTPYLFHFLYHDQSAYLSLELYDHEIVINRMGSSPSTNYMMQESVVVLDFLNELEQMALDNSRIEEDRLLILKDPKDTIDRARESVAFA